MPNVIGTQPGTRADIAVNPLARIAAPAVRPSASWRPARRTVASSGAARKLISIFWPGRAPIIRSIASTTRIARTLSFCDW